MLVTFKLDRLARSLHHSLTVLKRPRRARHRVRDPRRPLDPRSARPIEVRRIGFGRAVREGIDARTHNGRARSRPGLWPCRWSPAQAHTRRHRRGSAAYAEGKLKAHEVAKIYGRFGAISGGRRISKRCAL